MVNRYMVLQKKECILAVDLSQPYAAEEISGLIAAEFITVNPSLIAKSSQDAVRLWTNAKENYTPALVKLLACLLVIPSVIIWSTAHIWRGEYLAFAACALVAYVVVAGHQRFPPSVFLALAYVANFNYYLLTKTRGYFQETLYWSAIFMFLGCALLCCFKVWRELRVKSYVK